MPLGEDLTTEKIKSHFKNNFELTNYAIAVVRHMVRAGREMELDEILEDIAENPEKYNLEEMAKLESYESEK